MKTSMLVLTLALAACSPSDQPATPQADRASASAPAPAQMPAASDGKAMEATAKHASATGTIESIDVTAKTLTIAHGPVPELGWPAMTMTFQAPDVDLASYTLGDRIAFDLSVIGMKAKITSIRSR